MDVIMGEYLQSKGLFDADKMRFKKYQNYRKKINCYGLPIRPGVVLEDIPMDMRWRWV